MPEAAAPPQRRGMPLRLGPTNELSEPEERPP